VGGPKILSPKYSPENRQWTPAGELTEGMAFDTLTGELTVRSIEPLRDAASVFNIEVNGHHVYRVAGVGVLVHNVCQGRNELGQFARKNGGEVQPGSIHEGAVHDVVEEIADAGTASRQVRIQKSDGTVTVVDRGYMAGGRLRLVEAKGSATASFTKNQCIGYPQIKDTGGVVVGTGTKEFPAGLIMTRTQVQVVRPA